jgi:hypothetical protein
MVQFFLVHKIKDTRQGLPRLSIHRRMAPARRKPRIFLILAIKQAYLADMRYGHSVDGVTQMIQWWTNYGICKAPAEADR